MIFPNPALKSGLKAIKVDGCVTIDGLRADYVVESDRDTVIVELKGRCVEHGAQQIEATAAHWTNEINRADRVAGLIVARQYPRSSSKIQLKQQRFAKKFNAPLHIICSNCEIEFEKVFRFSNIRKR